MERLERARALHSKEEETSKKSGPTIEPEEIGRYFLKREMKKIFPRLSAATACELVQAVDELPCSLRRADLWKLVCGISEGFEQKGVYRLITDSKYRWT